MPQVEFIGDWDQSQAEAIALSLQKSLGVGDGGGAEATVQQLEDNPIQTLLSKRQKKLLELLRRAGEKAFEGAALQKSAEPVEHECGPDCNHDWGLYQLGSTDLAKAVGSLKRDAQGRTYKMNANNRWERFEPGAGGGALPEFRFHEHDGPFGDGVYFPVLREPSGYLRLRVRANLHPGELISDEQFYSLETDFAQELGGVLDSKGVRAIAQTEGDTVTLLCVRNPMDLQVLGAVANSGNLPGGGEYEYRLVNLTPADDHIVIDVEVAPGGGAETPQGSELIKAARAFGGTALSGTVLTPVSTPALDRGLVRHAVERCRLDGVPVDEVSIQVVSGVPDFLPGHVCAFCLPGEEVVYLVNHDPGEAIRRRLTMLTRQLRAATLQGALPSDVALDVLLAAQEIDPEWWLEGLIKRYVGAILCARVGCIMAIEDTTPWASYLGLLAGRGLSEWCDRRTLAECMAEDYRRAFDPAGLPNSVTMLYDLAVPQLARMAQQKLVEIVAGVPKPATDNNVFLSSNLPYFNAEN
jgi:hypothetical protein